MSTPNTTQKCSPITGKKEEDASGGGGILGFVRRGLCGGMPSSAAPSPAFGKLMDVTRKLMDLVLDFVLGGIDFAADSLAYLIDLFGQFRVAFELFHLLAFHFQRSNPRLPLKFQISYYDASIHLSPNHVQLGGATSPLPTTTQIKLSQK